MSYANRLIRVELGESYVTDPCPDHRASGWQADCNACADVPERKVAVPELDGFWVEIRNPRTLPWGEYKQLYTPLDEKTSPAQVRDRNEKVAAGLITAWNLKHANPGESDDPDAQLDIPKNDAGALDKAPPIVGAIFDAIARAGREPVVPKASATG